LAGQLGRSCHPLLRGRLWNAASKELKRFWPRFGDLSNGKKQKKYANGLRL
jgi:hypothetical protein